jgi:hypothetical protein
VFTIPPRLLPCSTVLGGKADILEQHLLSDAPQGRSRICLSTGFGSQRMSSLPSARCYLMARYMQTLAYALEAPIASVSLDYGYMSLVKCGLCWPGDQPVRRFSGDAEESELSVLQLAPRFSRSPCICTSIPWTTGKGTCPNDAHGVRMSPRSGNSSG